MDIKFCNTEYIMLYIGIMVSGFQIKVYRLQPQKIENIERGRHHFITFKGYWIQSFNIQHSTFNNSTFNLYTIKLIATVSAIDSTASDVLEVEMVW